jgi:hypothetical protein
MFLIGLRWFCETPATFFTTTKFFFSRKPIDPIKCVATKRLLQGCQMVYFQTRNPNLDKFWRALEITLLVYVFHDHVEYFTAICYNLWPFGIACGHWYIFHNLVCLDQEKSGNTVHHVNSASGVRNDDQIYIHTTAGHQSTVLTNFVNFFFQFITLAGFIEHFPENPFLVQIYLFSLILPVKLGKLYFRQHNNITK